MDHIAISVNAKGTWGKKKKKVWAQNKNFYSFVSPHCPIQPQFPYSSVDSCRGHVLDELEVTRADIA